MTSDIQTQFSNINSTLSNFSRYAYRINVISSQTDFNGNVYFNVPPNNDGATGCILGQDGYPSGHSKNIYTHCNGSNVLIADISIVDDNYIN